MDKVRQAVAAKKPSFAAWVSGTDPVCAEILGKAGYDTVILDNQHGGVTWDNMLRLIQAFDLGGTRPLVRTLTNDQAMIMRALDLGALGVVVPLVSTEAQARSAAEAAHYPPKGVRSFGPMRNYYAAGAGDEPLCFVMIETAEALQNLDAIAAIPGVDGLLVGPADLGLSLGVGLTFEINPKVMAGIDATIAACKRHGKISASASMGPAHTKLMLEHGMQFIAAGSDIVYIRNGSAADAKQFEAWRQEFTGR